MYRPSYWISCFHETKGLYIDLLINHYFKVSKDADKALGEMNGKKVDGSELVVRLAKSIPLPPNPIYTQQVNSNFDIVRCYPVCHYNQGN